MNTKYVIVQQSWRGRNVALRNLSFETMEAAKAHIANFPERIRDRYYVESRAVKADDTELRMTCQCCGRKILANMGTIAHHGYERPDYGYQTASCSGAKELPFEVDRAVLGQVIIALKDMQANMKKVRSEIANEERPIMRRWRTGYGAKEVHHGFEFTRANFATEEATKALRGSGRYEREFDDLLKVELAYHDSRIRAIAADIKAQQARYDGWKQTHKRQGGEWVAL